MVEVDHILDVPDGPVALGPTFDGHDFAMEALGDGVGQLMGKVGVDGAKAAVDHARGLIDRLESATHRPAIP